MTKTLSYYLLFLICLSFNSLFGLQYENQVIERVDIEMITLPEGSDFNSKSVTGRIKTRQGDVFSQVDFDNDLKMLSKDYDRVDPTLNSVDGKLFITLKLWSKPTIRSILWEGNRKMKCEKLVDELSITIGSVFDRQAFNKAFHKLKAFYVKKGFFEASLDYNISLDKVTNTVDITIVITEGRAGRIKRIQFDNFTQDEEDELVDMMVTKKYFFLTSWYTGDGTFNEDAMQQDRSVILNFLQNQGYADANVEILVTEDDKCDDRIIVTISAIRGELYYFGPISFEGNVLFSNEDIISQFTFSEGDFFSPEAIRKTVRRITDFYGRRGYIDAVVDYEPSLDRSSRSFSVKFSIEEAKQYRVGLIKVYGNTSTESNVILHETLLTPGEVFNTIKLQLTEEKLQNIGYFKHVNVYAVRSEGPGGLGGNYRDVHIEVEETSTGNFSAGFGLSSVESIFGEFRITERNFNYKGFANLWDEGYQALRGGGEFVSLNAMLGAKSRKYSLSWTKPFFRDTPWVVGFEAELSNNRYISDDYQLNAAGFTIHGSYPLNPFLRMGVHYRLRNSYVNLDHHKIRKQQRHLAKKAAKAALEGKEHKAEKDVKDIKKLKEELNKEAHVMGLVSAIGLNLNYDSTDHPSNPRNGFKSRLEQELAGFGGDHTFLGFAYLNKFYYPAGEKGVFKLRGDLRFIIPLFDTKRYHIPIDERLFLGGENTIRGYKVYRLGPQFTNNSPRGGMSMQIISAEYFRRVNGKLGAFLFCDSGHLSFDVWDFGTMYTSAGFGLELKVIEGTPPIVLGVGFPVNPRHKSDVKRFFFSIGGRF